MGDTSPRTYKVFKGNTAGQIIEMEIPVDAIQSPRETLAAFHRRVATAARISKQETRTPSSVRCP